MGRDWSIRTIFGLNVDIWKVVLNFLLRVFRVDISFVLFYIDAHTSIMLLFLSIPFC